MAFSICNCQLRRHKYPLSCQKPHKNRLSAIHELYSVVKEQDQWLLVTVAINKYFWRLNHKIVNHENLCKTIDEVLKIKEIKAIKIEILPDCEED